MKRAIWAVPVLVLLIGLPWLARASYTYFYSQWMYVPADWSNWNVYGGFDTACGTVCGATFFGTALYPGLATGEVKLTIARDQSNLPQAEYYYAYFLASGDPSLSTSTYYQFVLDCGRGAVGFNKRTYIGPYPTGNYVTTQLAVASASCGDSYETEFRFVVNVTPGNTMTAIAYLGNTRLFKYTWTPGADEQSLWDYGRAGFGTYICCGPPAAAVEKVDLGSPDDLAPNPVLSSSIGISSYVNHVDLSWPATTDDPNGTGVYGYEIWRNGYFLGSTTGLTFSDASVNPSTTYSYTLRAVDYHGFWADTNFNVTTPYIPTAPPYPSTSQDGRRVGVHSTGAYWGAGGENIDVMSGNLNFTLPLVKAQARGGWGVGFNLNYNSQNWRYDTQDWNFGGDVGYGYGWQLLAGSITPVLSDPFTISYYLFTDSTGAEYRLDQHSGNIWSSKESIYVYYDASAMVLHFRDGSFWYFGCISAPGEADQGVTYPTLMQDANGNQVLITYQTSPGATWINSSARITQIEDARGNGYSTYSFTYNTDSPVRHLTAINSNVGTGENYAFTYQQGQVVCSPFDSSGCVTTSVLQDVTVSVTGHNTDHEFSYNGSGEMTHILLPYKGYLGYEYTTTTYPNGTKYREVVQRHLSKDGIASTQYSFSHEASPTAVVHQFTQIDDPGGVGSKHWTFATSGLAMGLVTQYQGLQQPGAVPKIQNDYTWVQDANSNSYISSATTTADPGQSYAAAKKTDQTVDTYGNVTQVKTYDYGNLTTPVRTDNYGYLGGGCYSSYYILNRVTSTPTTNITYDEHPYPSGPGDAHEWAAPAYDSCRGNPTTVTSLSGTQYMFYDFAGGVSGSNMNGVASSNSTTNATNYSAPSQITVGSLSTTMTYNSFLGLTNETDPNGVTTTLGYDAMARPNSTTSPFGAVTTNTYNDTASPPTVQTSVNGRWTRTTMDGLGRTIKTETGDGSGTLSVAETAYDSCGCSPTGKMVQTALPHAPGATPVWTTYTYDGIGRTLTKTTAGTDTTSTTSYSYQGNTVTVTDAVGNWKKYTMNALGQLIQVNEPNPGTGGGGGGAGNQASFVGTDTTTQGNWHGVYGSSGYNVIGAGNSYPSYVTVTASGNAFYSWADPTTDTRGLYRDASSSTRIADTWYSGGPWTLDFSFSDNSSHNVAIYMVDWDSYGPRAQTVDVLDGSTGATLDTRSVTSFTGGQYWVWSLSGHVVLRFTPTAGNAVVSGIFFDGSGGGGGGGGGSNYVTTYTYDTLGHLTSVNMPRPTGTQTRTFNYGNPPGTQLLSATNPENGTVTYTYNSDMTLATKTDAKNQQVQYSYDSYKRVTEIRKGTYNGTFTEDTCQREDYGYDSGTYALGRLTSVQYQGGPSFYNGMATCDHTFSDSFVYNAGGGITSQSFGVIEPARNYSGGGVVGATLTASYTYDNEGRITATQYPSAWNGSAWVAGPNIGNTFDTMGRLQKVTDLGASSDIISNATYGPMDQILTMTGANGAPSETRTYNSIGQMTRLQSGSLNIQYAYSATQNNGKIASETDVVSGEQVTYTYDSLNRLASATGSGWGQSYNYDGFGNLTDQNVTSGTAPALHVTYDPSTNRRSGECADANGNLSAQTTASPCWSGYIYDVQNRITTQSGGIGSNAPSAAYAYNTGNKRIWKGTAYTYDSQTLKTTASVEEITFWGAGKKLGSYSLSQIQPGGPDTLPQLVAAQTGTNYYFGGKLIKNSTGFVTPDRLGSIGKYFPYGQERPSATTDGKEKFATYFRDSETGLDYAQNRYHQVGMGRFMTPDPFSGSASAKAPGSWNRYAYSGGDPVNNSDPSGLDAQWSDAGCNPAAEAFNPAGYMALCQGIGSISSNSIFNQSSCSVDGFSTDCSEAFGLAQAGAAVQCPDNACTSYNNGFQQFVAGAGGSTGYVDFSGIGRLNEWQGGFLNDRQFQNVVNQLVDGQQMALAVQIAKVTGQSVDTVYNALSGVRIQGGNEDFSITDSTVLDSLMNYLNQFGTYDRAGIAPSIHFSDGFVHLDTMNPWSLYGLGLLGHFFADVVGGNINPSVPIARTLPGAR